MIENGADIIEFFKVWPCGDDVCLDDTPFSEDEHLVVRLTDAKGNPSGPVVEPGGEYDFNYGVLCWQGRGPAPSGFDPDMARVFWKWVRARSTTNMVVEVPKEQLDAFKALMKANGWKATG